MAEPSRPARLWYQSFVHPVEQAPYIKRLQGLLDARRSASRNICARSGEGSLIQNRGTGGGGINPRAGPRMPRSHCHKPIFLIAVGSVLDLFFLQ
jgi:hypothetical protein